ncbi:MFS transporter [Cryobacterium sp. BB307]|uniref:MFS transporter n=1 Tax=Cryobacterium sp. BB307 TaxID=2716317 RepID=UPI00144520C7|nr:MFS transporter [Cryobacterium sp. BB307]
MTLVLLVGAQFVVMLDTSIVNVALPTIQDRLGLSHTGAAWTVNAYFLAFGGTLLLGGRLADTLGRRRLFTLAAVAFTVASVGAALASTEVILIAARAAQGLSAAVLSPTAMSILLASFPGNTRGRAMNAWGAASTLGGAIGVLVGGGVTAAWGWSAVFWITVPITAIAALSTRRLIPADTSTTRQRTPIDITGAASVTAAALSLIYLAVSVPVQGFGAPGTIVASIGGVAAMVVFCLAERRAADPILPLVLFRSRTVSLGLVVSLLGGAARASSFTIAALYLQQVMRMDAGTAGLAMVPTSVAGFVVTIVGLPRALRRLGARVTVTIGLVVLAVGHAWLSSASNWVHYTAGVLPGLLLIAVGVALSFTPTTILIADAMSSERPGLAAGMASASSQIGAALGVAVLTASIVAHAGPQPVLGASALSEGFKHAFLNAAGIATTAALLALSLVIANRERPVFGMNRLRPVNAASLPE